MEVDRTVWDPLTVFNCPMNYKYAMVVLNRPILIKPIILLKMWERAQITVTVDGGTDRWLNYLQREGIDLLSKKYDKYIPDLITGDMDSCSPILIEKLKAMGSNVIITPDQSFTDYTKALVELKKWSKKKDINLNAIFVLAETTGRFDHILANVDTLYKTNRLVDGIKVIQIASDSLTWLLNSGFHKISIPDILLRHNSWCGLLPIGSPVKHVSTTGLKWNLNDSCIQFGHMISTSNTYNNYPEVTINLDVPLIWTMGIEPLLETEIILSNGHEKMQNNDYKL